MALFSPLTHPLFLDGTLMAAPWLSILKAVPWTDVLSNAPAVADGARKLWKTVAGRDEAPAAPAAAPAAPAPAPSENSDAPWVAQADFSALAARTAAAEAAVAALQDQLSRSSALLHTLAEQNAQLAQGLELLRRRQRQLAGALVAAGLLGLAAWGLLPLLH